jgi:D-hexose-6-phosphate mutarotase
MLPSGVRLERGSGDLERLSLETPQARAQVYLHGAHIAHFQPAGARPVLWVSRSSYFEAGTPGKPIRGGVPVCFPWFAQRKDQPSAPMHGFARNLTWRLGTVASEGDAVQATLHLESSDFTRSIYPHDFAAQLVVTVSARLKMELVIRNTGLGPMTFEDALHSYFALGDSRRAFLRGLEGAPYIDKADKWARKTGEAAPIAIARETDRVYPGARGTVTIEDPVWHRRIRVEKSGSATTVVWNPWIDRAKALADFGDEEWTEMVCVETVNALDDAITLAPGATHTLAATIEVTTEAAREP